MPRIVHNRSSSYRGNESRVCPRIDPWAETTETSRQYTGLASRVSRGMGVPCSRSNPNRVCGDGFGAATASVADVGVSAGREGSASANWVAGTSLSSRSAVSSGSCSSITEGTATGSARWHGIGQNRRLSVFPLPARDRDSGQRNQNRCRHADLQNQARQSVSIQVSVGFGRPSISPSVSRIQAWRSGRTLSRFPHG